jgi:imidazole glycerol phosphate synthase glutamine amidotransferase subunit
MKVAIVDYGAGNLPSVERALQKLGAETERAVRPEQIANATAVVLPGVGHFSAFVAGLHERNLTSSLRMAHDSGVPILGICLGLQAMYESSDEAPGDPGLGFFKGEVRMLPQNVKAPHIGWNQVERRQPSQLLMGIPDDAYFYFAHSYAAPGEGNETAAVCNHGVPFAAVIESKNLAGVQFHPEKSGETGARVLKNFLESLPRSRSEAKGFGQ